MSNKCRAKDPATCPHHGANFITSRLYSTFGLHGKYGNDNVKDYQHMVDKMLALIDDPNFVASCDGKVTAKDLVVTLESFAMSKQEKYNMDYVYRLATYPIATEFLFWKDGDRDKLPPVNYLDETQIIPGLWETGYNNALAKYMVKNGHPVTANDSIYNWEDYDMRNHTDKCGIAAINDIHESSWYEWGGTFVSDDYDGSRYGIDCYGQCNCGRFKGKLRYEGNMGEVIRAVTRSIPLNNKKN